MAYPPFDYIARHDVYVNGVVGYRTGDGMYRDVVNDLGLSLGIDVDAARADLFDRPADTAPPAAWRDYALAQDNSLGRDDVDDMTRADLIARFPDPDKPEPKAEPKPKAEKAQPKP